MAVPPFLFSRKKEQVFPLLAQKEVMHVPATAWKRGFGFHDLHNNRYHKKIYVPGECGKVEFIQVEAKKNA